MVSTNALLVVSAPKTIPIMQCGRDISARLFGTYDHPSEGLVPTPLVVGLVPRAGDASIPIEVAPEERQEQAGVITNHIGHTEGQGLARPDTQFNQSVHHLVRPRLKSVAGLPCLTSLGTISQLIFQAYSHPDLLKDVLISLLELDTPISLTS